LQSIEVEGRDRDQVGRDLGLGLSGVKMALHRARKRLVMAVAKNLGCSSAQIARFPAKTRAAG
jgi:DNA-directed RNA polymerase specialized sigma24 family protein